MEQSTKTIATALASLYADAHASTDADITALAEPALESVRSEHDSGDTAIQSILTQFVLNNSTSAAQSQRLSNALAGIKQFLVHEIISEFPTTSIEALREAAEAAGYEIEILA